MSDDPYARAVRRFIDLLEAPLQAEHVTPRALARACGVAPNSGYRSLYAMEAAGVLRRDQAGAYRRGPEAVRIGLSALGVGAIALAAEPVLDQLRREAGLTAFAGRLSETALHIGPFAFGRGADFVTPRSAILALDGASAPPPSEPRPAASLLMARDGAELRLASCAPLSLQAAEAGGSAVVGLLSLPHPLQPIADQALAAARERFEAALASEAQLDV